MVKIDAGIKKQSYRQPPQKNTTGFWTSSQTNNELYYSPLHNAIWAGKLYEARQYLEEGANVCKTARNNKTPLMVAVEKGSLEAIKLLFEFGADVTMQIAFLEAITLGKIDIINFFISNKVLINCTYRERTTPLIEAIRVGNFDVVKILIENGADVNFTTDEGKYPLFEALKLNNCEITKYLISKGAKMQAKWLKHFTSQIVKNLTTMEIELKSILLGDFVHNTIVKAVETKSALVVKYLLEQGVPIDLCDKNEKSPLAVAANEGYFRIVKILVDAGADILSAQKELQEFAKQNEDFYIYYQVLKQKCKTIPTPEDSVNESSQTED
ncbi:ankyrin repeat and KH domain-containing protein mask-like [Tribolium madens]|uniref:ankyrin repeat and KH domain-containing protein mask-like n=1 Tax=Tribolium madens TaxID=41895 RepID=UPI001CF759A1|nr:ankyrin repeat and KH domain-containing protein mask-like [Tribolium madens]